MSSNTNDNSNSSSSSTNVEEVLTEREIEFDNNSIAKKLALLDPVKEPEPEQDPAKVAAEADQIVHVEIPDTLSHVKSKYTWNEMGFPTDRAEALLKQLDKKGWRTPVAIQAKALPYFLKLQAGTVANGMLGQAFNGSGKTGAFSIAALCRLNLAVRGPQVIVIAPTNPLASQLAREIASLAEGLRLMPPVTFPCVDPTTGAPSMNCTFPRVVHVSAGHNANVDAEIVVGTETMLFRLMKSKLMDRKQIHTLIIDEADELLQKSRAHGTLDVRSGIPDDAVTILFSASLDSLDPVKGNQSVILTSDRVLKLVKKDPKNEGNFIPTNPLPLVAKIIQPPRLDTNIVHATVSWDVTKSYRAFSDDENKKLLLEKCDYVVNFMQCMPPNTRFLIFVNTNADTAIVGEELKAKGIDSCAVYRPPDLKKKGYATWQDSVVNTIAQFRAGKFSVLIGTGQLARGLDIPNLEIVVNFNIPLRYDTRDRDADIARFQHQSGRVGRLGQTKSGLGTCIHLLSSNEEALAFQTVSQILHISPLVLDKKVSYTTHAKLVTEALEAKAKEGNETVSGDDSFQVFTTKAAREASLNNNNNRGPGSNAGGDVGGKK